MRFLEQERLRQGEYGEDEAPPLPRLDPRPIRRFFQTDPFFQWLGELGREDRERRERQEREQGVLGRGGE
jgi:hypothetical protein